MDSRLYPLAILGLAFGLSPAAAQAPAPDAAVAGPGERVAELRALDKITARTFDIEAPVDETVRFGTLDITVRYCRTRPPEEPPETFAFLEIDDEPPGRIRRPVFSGWMVASSPALNPLEHPVYDVWVLTCRAAHADRAG